MRDPSASVTSLEVELRGLMPISITSKVIAIAKTPSQSITRRSSLGVFSSGIKDSNFFAFLLSILLQGKHLHRLHHLITQISRRSLPLPGRCFSCVQGNAACFQQ